MKKFTCFLLLLSLFTTGNAQKTGATPNKRFRGLDTALTRILDSWHAAGFAIGIVNKDSIIYAKGFGYRDYENKLPVTTKTLFAIGSCTKAFTASLLGQLREEGKVDFDIPVREYLPTLKFYNEEMNNHATLRDMMCHRTGLPRHDNSWYLWPAGTRDSLVARIQYMEPSAGLREKWQYNNFMFMLQGMVVEKLTGKSWDANIQEKILNPLGMTNTVTTLADWVKSADASIGYTLVNDTAIKKLDYYNIAGMSPAGSINSNINDLAKWVRLWINNGKWHGSQLLPADYMNEAIVPQMAMAVGISNKAFPDIHFSGYGFGWTVSSYKGHYRVEHGGAIDGFTSTVSFFPSDSLGIIVLTNQDGALYLPAVIRNTIADKILGLPYFDWTAEMKKRESTAKAAAQKMQQPDSTLAGSPVTKPTHALKDYTGSYCNKGYGCFEFVLNGDSLFAATPIMKFWLKHDNYDVFTVLPDDKVKGIDSSDLTTKARFNLSIAGDIESVSINMEEGIKPVIFTRMYANKPGGSTVLK